MSLWNEPKITAIAAYSRNLQEAMEAAQSAKYSGDERALGYAEGQALRWKREIAKLDPRGYGAQHLSALTQAERDSALAQ